MKKYSIIFIFLISISSAQLTSCKGEKKQEPPTDVTKEQYQCPMKCTQQMFDKPDSCPVCGMDLEKVTNL